MARFKSRCPRLGLCPVQADFDNSGSMFITFSMRDQRSGALAAAESGRAPYPESLNETGKTGLRVLVLVHTEGYGNALKEPNTSWCSKGRTTVLQVEATVLLRSASSSIYDLVGHRNRRQTHFILEVLCSWRFVQCARRVGVGHRYLSHSCSFRQSLRRASAGARTVF